MVPEAILTALFLGWLLHGKFMRLADAHVKYFWMIFVPLGLYLASYGLNYSHVFKPHHWVFGLVHTIELLTLCVVAVANRHIPGVKLMFAGLAVNLVAIIANGGYMPTAAEAMRLVGSGDAVPQLSSAVRHSLIDAGTRLTFLCDILPAKWPYALVPSVYSFGDIVTSLGGLIAIVAIMRNPKYSQRLTPQGA